MKIKTTLRMMAVVWLAALTALTALTALAGAALAEGEGWEARFSGGSFDGWDRYTLAKPSGLGGALVTLTSGEHQVFDFFAEPTLATLIIAAENPAGVITNGGALRISVPEGWNCRFDSGVDVVVGGEAQEKVGPPVYTDGGRTLVLPVVQDFAEDDVLTIAGLKLLGLRLTPPSEGRLELDFDGDGLRDKYDDYSLTVRALWPGGSYDGWDGWRMSESGDMLRRDGTAIWVR